MADAETELKLEFASGAVAAVLASGLLSGTPHSVHFHSTYFDTPDHLLHKAGLSLRIRTGEGRRVQSIKVLGGRAAGLFVRGEWEHEIAGDRPLADERTPLPAILGDRAGELVALFTVDCVRRLWRGHGIEIALDHGRVEAGGRQKPFCELELEQQGAAPDLLFTIARPIVEQLPARIGVQSKADRGYALLNKAESAVKAGSITLEQGMPAADAFRRIVSSCLHQFLLNEAVLLQGHHPGAVHQARVALRRLRSALAVCQPMLDDRAVALNEALRWLADQLSVPRDLDVLIARLGTQDVPEQLRAARALAYDRAVEALESPRARLLMFDVVEWLHRGAWSADPERAALRAMVVERFAADVLDRFRRRVRRQGRHLDELDDPGRHRVRKSAKKLRYAVNFFASVFTGPGVRRRRRRFEAALETLQDSLGTLNDIATAPMLLARLGLEDSPLARQFGGEPAARAHHLARAMEAYEELVDARRFWR